MPKTCVFSFVYMAKVFTKDKEDLCICYLLQEMRFLRDLILAENQHGISAKNRDEDCATMSSVVYPLLLNDPYPYHAPANQHGDPTLRVCLRESRIDQSCVS